MNQQQWNVQQLEQAASNVQGARQQVGAAWGQARAGQAPDALIEQLNSLERQLSDALQAVGQALGDARQQETAQRWNQARQS